VLEPVPWREPALSGAIHLAAAIEYVIQLSIDALHADARGAGQRGLDRTSTVLHRGRLDEEARTTTGAQSQPNHATEYTGRPIYDSTNALGEFLPATCGGRTKATLESV